MSEEELEKVLFEKALGYESSEIVEEYLLDDDGNKKLNKCKITKKHVPPDIPAAKVLLEHSLAKETRELKNMTYAELLEERDKLINELKEMGKNGNS